MAQMGKKLRLGAVFRFRLQSLQAFLFRIPTGDGIADGPGQTGLGQIRFHQIVHRSGRQRLLVQPFIIPPR